MWCSLPTPRTVRGGSSSLPRPSRVAGPEHKGDLRRVEGSRHSNGSRDSRCKLEGNLGLMGDQMTMH